MGSDSELYDCKLCLMRYIPQTRLFQQSHRVVAYSWHVSIGSAFDFVGATMNVSLLIAAGATSFVLIQKEAKNQDEKILPRSWPLPIGPGFSSGLYALHYGSIVTARTAFTEPNPNAAL